jgi:putative ABC transport system substrate-binding protein
MERRQVLTLIGGVIAWRSACFGAFAQPARQARIGFISAAADAGVREFLDFFREGMAIYGYVEPGALAIEVLLAENAPDRIPAMVDELERRRVDVIVTHGRATWPVVNHAARTIPAVYAFSGDPVSAGFAGGLARPLFNATGVTLMLAEVNGKRMELMREIMPRMRRIAVLGSPLHPGEERERTVAEESARRLGLEVAYHRTSSRDELDRALDALQTNPPEAALLFTDTVILAHRRHILDFMTHHRIPVVTGWSAMAESGALVVYGPRRADAFRRVAYFVDRLLKGAKAAELPIEQPTVMELIVNLESARRLGLDVPRVLVAAADRIID